jgi:hypothetical protein
MAVAAAIESDPVQLKSVREDIKELLRTGRGSPHQHVGHRPAC